MADGQQNRFPGVRSFAHLGGAGGHTEGVGRAMGYTEGAERGRGLSGVTFHAHLETQMADGLQNRFPGVRSFAHLGGAGGHTEGVGRAMGYTEGAERGRGLSGVTFHAHLETQMADGLQNRFPGVRSFAHLGGAGGHTRGWEGRWAIQRGEKCGGLYRGVGRATCLYRGVGRAVGYTEGAGRAMDLYRGV